MDTKYPEEIVDLTEQFIQSVRSKFPRAIVHISEILPRQSANMNEAVNKINELFRKRLAAMQNVKLVTHSALKQSHLRDERHLNYRWQENDSKMMSGTMWLAGDFINSVLGTRVTQKALLVSRLRPSDIYPFQ